MKYKKIWQAENEAVVPENGFAFVGGDALGTHDRWASWIPESFATHSPKILL
jgi:hypothetical protein